MNSDAHRSSSALDQLLHEGQRDLKNGHFDRALERAQAVLAAEPDNQDGLYLKAVAQRYLHRHEDADATLRHLLEQSPNFGRGYQERAHLERSRGAEQAALFAYQQAVRYNRALVVSWKAIAELDANQQPKVQAQLSYLSALPKPVLAALNHFDEGRILKAENLLRTFLKANPLHVEGMRLLAEIGVALGVMEDADFLLESAADIEPNNVQVRLDYIQVLRKRQKFEQALSQARNLFDTDPNSPLFESHLAIELMQVGDYEEALRHFDSVLKKLPNDPATLTSKGHALKTAGRQAEAIEAYHGAIHADLGHADAYYALANLKTYRFSDIELSALQDLVADGALDSRARIHVAFALGKAHEDRAEYDDSFHHYKEGNALMKQSTRYRAGHIDREFAAQIKACTGSLFETKHGSGHQASDPIFVVGLPRAGSTLLEQILASHSQVDGTLELPNILSMAHGLRAHGRATSQSAYPDNLEDLGRDELEALGRRYIDETRVHRKGAPFFVDKMPNNFRHIGLIKLILPRAKVIDARREPMACCFSGFKQLFAEGQEFTYGLEEMGRYYRGYTELMAHWDRVLPGFVLRVHYEDVVGDLKGQVRRMLDFCGLPFEQSCTEFHNTERSVRTASSEQVRQPIYQSGIDQWRHFAPHLQPLRDALGPALQGYRS